APLLGDCSAGVSPALRDTCPAVLEPHFHGVCVRLQAFRARQGYNRRAKARQALPGDLLNRDALHKIRRAQAATQTRRSTGGQNVIRAGSIIPRCDRTVTAQENRAGRLDSIEQTLSILE